MSTPPQFENPPVEVSNYPREGHQIPLSGNAPGAYLRYIGDALKLICANPLVFLGGMAVSFVLITIAKSLVSFFVMPLLLGRTQYLYEINPLSELTTQLAFLVPTVFANLIYVGFSVSAIHDKDGRRPSFSDIFSGFKNLASSVMAVLLITVMCSLIMTGVAYLLSILTVSEDSSMPWIYGRLFLFGGIFSGYMSLAFLSRIAFAPILTALEGFGAFEAIKESFRITRGKGLALFGVYLLSALVTMSGYVACFIGYIITGPVLAVVIGLHYRDYRALLAARSQNLPPM